MKEALYRYGSRRVVVIGGEIDRIDKEGTARGGLQKLPKKLREDAVLILSGKGHTLRRSTKEAPDEQETE